MVKDRTKEFKSITEAAITRQAVFPALSVSNRDRSEFSSRAANIGKDIHAVSDKLQQLARLARARSLFDDRPIEIEELTAKIKHDISLISRNLIDLEEYQRNQRGFEINRQTQEHSSNIVVSLRSKLMNTSNNFKEVLKIRSSNMKEQQERRERFGAELSFERPTFNTQVTSYQQLDLVTRKNTEIESRNSAIETIESTIAELGQVFQHLAHLVSAQGETVQRIDANMEEMQMNIEGGQAQLLKYFKSVNSNRWLMLKMFGVIILFVFIFFLFMA